MSEPGRMDAEKGSTDERTVGLRSCGDCWRCCQDLRIGEKAPGSATASAITRDEVIPIQYLAASDVPALLPPNIPPRPNRTVGL